MFKIPTASADTSDTSAYLTMGFVPVSIPAVRSPKFSYTVVRMAYAKCGIKMTMCFSMILKIYKNKKKGRQKKLKKGKYDIDKKW